MALRERARLLRAGRFEPAWLGALERRIGGRRRRDRGGAAAGDRAASAPRSPRRPAGLPQPELALDRRGRELAGRAAGARRRGALRRGARRRPRARTPRAARPPSARIAAISLVRDRATRPAGARLLDRPAEGAADRRGRWPRRALRAAAGEQQPILLLDEVAAHLDAERRAELFEELAALGAQAWLTGTDAGVFAPLGARAQFFTVQDFDIAAP